MLPRGFPRSVNMWLKKNETIRLFLSYLPSKLSINKCKSSSYKWSLRGCLTFCQDLQHPPPDMPHSVCYVWNEPGRVNVCIPRGWYDSWPGSICSSCLQVDKSFNYFAVFCDWLIEGNLPPRPLLICCCRAAVRHSPGCNADSTALLLWGRQRSAAAGCLPVSQQHTHTQNRAKYFIVVKLMSNSNFFVSHHNMGGILPLLEIPEDSCICIVAPWRNKIYIQYPWNPIFPLFVSM